MNAATLRDRLDRVKGELEGIERALAEGRAPRDSLGEFKDALDHVRFSAWALLTEADAEVEGGGTQSIVAQFRLGRAVEMCEQLRRDIAAGLIPSDHSALLDLETTLEGLLARVRRLGTPD